MVVRVDRDANATILVTDCQTVVRVTPYAYAITGCWFRLFDRWCHPIIMGWVCQLVGSGCGCHPTPMRLRGDGSTALLVGTPYHETGVTPNDVRMGDVKQRARTEPDATPSSGVGGGSG